MLLGHSPMAWVALLLSCGQLRSKSINSFAGPYIAYADRFSVCPSVGNFVWVIKVSHFNPTKPYERQRIWINATHKQTIDDSYWGSVKLAIRSNNEWKENALVFDFPGGHGCSVLREHIPGFFRLLTKSMPELHNKKTPCSIPPGHYEVQNESINWEFPRFKVLPYARYRLTLTGGHGTRDSRVAQLCVEADCSAIPRPF